MTTELHVFISSRMQELAPERQALGALLPTLGGDLVALRAWVFEDDAPAADKPIRDVYLDALKASALYIGLFWNEYGNGRLTSSSTPRSGPLTATSTSRTCAPTSAIRA